MINAIIVSCFLGIGCMVNVSDRNPFSTVEACEAAVVQMKDELLNKTFPELGLDPKAPGFKGAAGCVDQEQYDDIMQQFGNRGASN